MKNRYYITIIIAFLALVSCQKEELYRGPCNVRFKAYVQDEVSVTREGNSTDAFAAELFISNGATVNSSTLQWDGTEVTTNLKLEEGTYSFYGYSPKRQNATFDTSTQIMSVPGISGLSADNAMLLRIDETSHTDGTLQIAQNQETATVSLKMDHLMAKVTPHFYVNSTYDKLRTIKIKKVEFSIDGAKKYSANVNYTDAVAPAVSWTEGDEEDMSLTVFSGAEALELTTSKQPVGHFYLCPAQSVESLKMKVTYDVYDKTGAKTREDVTADNAILKLKDKGITAGTNYMLNIQIVPTYLYVLSDNDEPVLIIP